MKDIYISKIKRTIYISQTGDDEDLVAIDEDELNEFINELLEFVDTSKY